MFEIFKKVSVDLTHITGKINLFNEYDVIAEHVYENHTIINLYNSEKIELWYLDNDGVILINNNSYYYTKVMTLAEADGEEEYDSIVEQLKQDTMSLELDDDKLIDFDNLWKNVAVGTELIKDSSDDELINNTFSMIGAMFINDDEICFLQLSEDGLMAFIGVEISKEQIL